MHVFSHLFMILLMYNRRGWEDGSKQDTMPTPRTLAAISSRVIPTLSLPSEFTASGSNKSNNPGSIAPINVYKGQFIRVDYHDYGRIMAYKELKCLL